MVLSSVAWPFTQGPPFTVPVEVSKIIYSSETCHASNLTTFVLASEKLLEISYILFLSTQWKKIKLALQIVKSESVFRGTSPSLHHYKVANN